MPSKYSKTKISPLLKKKDDSNGFSLAQEEEFSWLDFKFTLSMTALLAVIHLSSGIIFGGDVLWSVPNKLVELFALNNYLVLNNFEFYRIVTSMLIHGSIIHLGGNLLFFLIFSIRLEELKGWKIAMLIFFVTGIAGNLLTLFVIGPNPAMWSLGASGAVDGVFSANLLAMRNEYDKGSISALFFIIIFASLTLAGQNTNFLAHLGGLIAGVLVMYFIEER